MTAQPSAHVLQQDLVVNFSYPVHFMQDVFAAHNPALSQSLHASAGAPKLLVFAERVIVPLFPDMPGRIAAYAQAQGIDLVDVRWAARRREGTSPWLARMLVRKPPMLVIMALANKMARIVWALMANGGFYRSSHGTVAVD